MLRVYNQIKTLYENRFNFIFINLDDKEFFERYSDGVPVYNETKEVLDKYALIHYDGPHDTENVLNETKFFLTRTVLGSIMVYDDVSHYKHDLVDTLLLESGFEALNRTERKISYIKTKEIL
jgi:hypothetical protein